MNRSDILSITGKPTSTDKKLTQNQTTNSIINGTQTTNTQANASSSESKVSDYLDPTSRAALEQLIRSLSGGSIVRGPGSENANAANKYGEQRLKEIGANQANRADYSKANAFADAKNAMNASLAKALEEAMPTLTAGIDAAGTSGSAMQALLTQQAAENAAREAATLGLNAAISYGQLQTGFGDILERLTSEGDPVTNQLMQALGIAKGAYEDTKATSNSSSTQNSTTNTSQISTETSTLTQKEKENEGKGAGGYQFQKFPDMSTPGYSSAGVKKVSEQLKAGKSSSSSAGYTGAYGW